MVRNEQSVKTLPQCYRNSHRLRWILRHMYSFRSDPLRTEPNRYLLCFQWFMRSESGAPGRNRTADLRFTKPLLYQLSYKGTALRLAYSPRQ